MALDKCFRCDSYVTALDTNPCGACRRLESQKSEASHKRHVRCPKCRHIWDYVGEDWDHPEIREEGKHEIECVECEYEFTIETWVTVEFVSPDLIEVEDSENAFQEKT